MSRIHELTININGNLGNSFSSSFQRASFSLSDLQREARQVQRELNRLATDFSQGRIHESQFREETERLTRELNRLERQQKRINAFKSFGNNAISKTKAFVGTGLTVGGAVATTAIAKSIETAANFEQQMSKVAAISGATGSDFSALQKQARELGATTIFSASQAAEGMEYLALAGYDTNKILSAMPGLLDMAAASQMDLGTAADIVTDVMSAFGMTADQAGHAADVFAYAQAHANTNVEQMGEAMKYAAPMANQMGWSIEETSAAMMKLADSGLKGSIAGQAWASSVGRLSKPTKAMKKEMDRLNISFFDAKENMKSLPEVVKELEKGFEGLSMKERSAAITTLFGAEAYKHWAILLEAGSETLATYTKELEKSDGTAKKMAATMTDNFSGAKLQLFSALEAAQISFATPILPVLQRTFKGIAGTITNNLPAIENAGEKVANVLDNITKPFQVFEEPVKPEITPEMNFREAEDALAKYQEELKNYELYGNMTFSEKIEYMLDETVEIANEWLQGEGGEAISAIFKELGTLAGHAWINSFTSAISGSAESASEGDLVGAITLALFANAMTGGLLGKGIWKSGKWALNKARNRTTSTITPTSSGNNRNNGSRNDRSSNRNTDNGNNRSNRDSSNRNSRSSRSSSNSSNTKWSKVAKFGKYGGKILAPLALLGYGLDFFTSDNKWESGGAAVGGLGGAAAGALIGGTIGSVVPGIGTTIGAVAGGFIGGLGGDWLGGTVGKWLGDKFGSNNVSKASTQESNNAAASVDFTALNNEIAKATTNASILSTYLGQASGMVFGSFYPLQEQTNLTAHNMSLLSTYAGQACGMIFGSFYPLQEQTNIATHNMSLLSTYLGQACGWIFSLMNIQTAGQRVVRALNNLESRINNVQLPEGRVSYDS